MTACPGLGKAPLFLTRSGYAGRGRARRGAAWLVSTVHGEAPLSPGSAVLGWAWHGRARHVQARPGQAAQVPARHDQARPGEVRPDLARPGLAPQGKTRLDMVWLPVAGLPLVRLVPAWLGIARPDVARRDWAGRGTARRNQARLDSPEQVWLARTSPGGTRHGWARLVKARPGFSGLDLARRDLTTLGRTVQGKAGL